MYINIQSQISPLSFQLQPDFCLLTVLQLDSRMLFYKKYFGLGKNTWKCLFKII